MEELENFCESDELTLERLQERIRSIPPDALKQYETFLHDICMNTRVSLEIVEFILGVFPGSTSMGTALFDRFGNTLAYPLHLACTNPECPNSVIELLVKKYEAALSHLCIVGGGAGGGVYDEYAEGTPLHYYFVRKSNIEINTVKMLVEAHPAALTTADDESKFTPLHTLISNPNIGALCDILQYLIKENPYSLRMICGYGEVLLHLACKNMNIASKTIRLLLNAWPEACIQRCDYGELPIHDLCSNKSVEDTAALDILNVLLKMNPQSVAVTNNDGELPIHWAVGSKSPKFCKVLIDAYPESVRIEGSGGMLLIHNACCGGRRVDTVKCLLELYPESVNVQDTDGFLPIHRAAQSMAGEDKAEIISFLLSKYPDGVEKATAGGGSLPLHLACESFNARDINLKTVQLLFDAYPEAIFKSDRDGKGPLDLARRWTERRQNNSNVVTFLETQLAYSLQAQDVGVMTTLDQNGALSAPRIA